MATGVSYAQTQPITCSSCGRVFDFTVWLIVDTVARPDLLARIRKGTLHDVTCPHCRADLGRVEAPLLVYTPSAPAKKAGKKRHAELLFSPTRGSTTDQHQSQAVALLTLLRTRPGVVWRDEWKRKLAVVPRELLSIALASDPKAALQETLTDLRALVARLRQEDPVAYSLLEDEALKAVTKLLTTDPISAAILALLQADSLAALLRVARDHPVILTPEAEARISEGVQRTRHTESEIMTQLVESRYRMLLHLYQTAQARGLNLDEAVQTIAEWEALRYQPDEIARRTALANALNEFLQAPSWHASRRILEDNPDLLSDEADALLVRLSTALRHRGNEGDASIVEDHRTLLRRCREVGIPRAFAEKFSPPESPATP